MERIIKYFQTNSRLNYTILLFLIFVGITSYIKIPKELFPVVELNQVVVKGSYAGASANSLNNIVVAELEKKIQGVTGVKTIESTIINGYFSIYVELKDNAKPIDALNQIKDAISAIKSNFPEDMIEPSTYIVKKIRSLLSISFSSTINERKEVLKKAKQLQDEVLKIQNISDVIIFGDSDEEVLITLDTQKLKAYNLNPKLVAETIRSFSYIYPVGNIEERGGHIYVSTGENKANKEFWQDALLDIAGKKIYLKDIASILVYYPDKETISRLNGNPSITLRVFQEENSNAIELSKKVREVFKKFEQNNPETEIEISYDSSKPIKDRLDTVISNISFGLILVGFAMYILISARISFVVTMGIPFSFIIGIITMYYLGYSINMVLLLATLITLGIVVDDAIVVSENIQRHIDNGVDVKTAAFIGTKEMIMPVCVAAFTTVFAFLPMLYLTGRIGTFLTMIPAVVSILILASLIESFLFLPLHAEHIIKPKEKHLNWEPLYNWYERVLRKLIHFKKIFLIIFLILIPVLTYFGIKKSNFQFFPRLDSDDITVSVKFDESKSIEDTDKLAKIFEKKVIENMKPLFIQSVNSVVGSYKDISNKVESIENGFTMTLELQDYKEDNWIQNYLNPIFTFSFDFEQKEKIRTDKSHVIIKKLRQLLTPLSKQYKAQDINVIGRRVGIVKTDIQINLASKNKELLLKTLLGIKDQLSQIKGIEEITDNAMLGKSEFKFSINEYGKNLGLSEEYISRIVANYYFEKKQTKTFGDDGIIDVKTSSKYKDSLESLKEFELPIGGKYVKLEDVVTFTKKQDFNKIEKKDSKIFKSIFANVDYTIITPTEVLNILDPYLKEIENSGVTVEFGGEKEQNEQLKRELTQAGVISLFLIFMTLLINFPSFRISFIILSVIPFTILGSLIGHLIMGMNLTMPSIIGILGLAGVVINDGIIMLDFLKNARNKEEFFSKAKQRVRPILITSITTILGLSTLIFYPTGQGVVLQPTAISLGFGLMWGTVLNLFYVPALFALIFNIKE